MLKRDFHQLVTFLHKACHMLSQKIPKKDNSFVLFHITLLILCCAISNYMITVLKSTIALWHEKKILECHPAI